MLNDTWYHKQGNKNMTLEGHTQTQVTQMTRWTFLDRKSWAFCHPP